MKLLLIFVLVLVLVSRKQPIWIAIFAGAAATWLLYGISLQEGLLGIYRACVSWDTVSLILVMYIVTFLQKMMGKRNAIQRAQKGLSALFNNRWVNCAAAPIFIGMLPTPNAAFIAGDVVKASAADHLNHDEMAVTTTYFRHVSESFMPTYGSIILALGLAGVSAGEFVVGMLPIVLCIVAAGCFWFLRKVPMKTQGGAGAKKAKCAAEIGIGLWPILVCILMVVILKMQILTASSLVLVVYFLIHRFRFGEIKGLFAESLQFKLYLNTLAVMVLKEFLTVSGVISTLPDFFAKLPIPSFLVFILIFFFGSVVSGSSTIIGLCMPVAMATVPGAGLPLVCLLMGVAYAAMQISPTHVCLTLTADYFEIPFGRLIRKTLPAVMTTVAFTVAYYLVWNWLV
ncbi:MAG: DUF401 family protein [Clostridia bacterium]|nr:DUF401 family protein [Clostridia bacterium]MBR5869220.1 DUF401 family protein [Clostridia bacterium]